MVLAGSAVLAVSPAIARQSQLAYPQGGVLLQAQFQSQGSYLGVHLVDIDADRAATLKLSEARGVEVAGVQPASPAAKAGLKAGDVILTYNGENVLGAQQLGRLVAETPPGRRIKIQYWRSGKTAETVVTTASIEQFANSLHLSNGVPPGLWSDDSAKLEAELLRLQAASFGIPMPLMVWKNSVLGLLCEPIDEQLAQYFGVKRGVLVRSVEKDGPADKAGIKAGDILTAIGDRSVSGPRDVTSYMRGQTQPVRSLTVELTRNRKPMTVHILVNEQQ
jgi:serine protease Do